MTLRNYTNTSVQTTIAIGIDASVTSLTVADVTGYPAAPFAIVIDPDSATAEEVLLVTGVVGATFTVTRAYDGTTGKAHSAGATVIHAAIAADFVDLQTADSTHASLTTTAHGGIVADTDGRMTDSRTPTAHDIGGALHTGTLTDALHGSRGGGTLHANVVAAGAAGFMAGTDKAKLDGIASGATANTGTVTSVALTVPSILSVAGSPVATSGTLAITLATESANLIFGGPTTGSPATPTFRALVANDIPSPLTTQGDLLYRDSSAPARLPLGANTYYLRSNGTEPSWEQISASEITIGTLSVVRGGTGVAAIPAFSVHKNSTNQTGIVTSTFTKLTWSTEAYDTNNNFASDKFTPTVAGRYLFIVSIQWISSSDQVLFYTILYKNGASVREFSVSTSGASNQTQVTGVAVVDANGSTDYFEVYGIHLAGANRDINGNAATTYFTGIRIGP